MSHDESNANRPLSEISHLFLSSIRDAAGNGHGPRPQRTPPRPPPTFTPRANVSMDLTPEEYAQVFGGGSRGSGGGGGGGGGSSHEPMGLSAPASGSDRVAPVTAVIASHLSGGDGGFERVKQYARHLAAPRKRIGLIEADASEFRVMCFDGTIAAATSDAAAVADDAPALESYDPRRMAEAIAELNWDVDRWLLFLPNPRMPEARALLRDVSDWALLSTCDHDGVVACYRTLKGLADTRLPADRLVARPRLTLAVLGVAAADADGADRVFRKLASVCQQFLDWPLKGHLAVRDAERVAEHLVVCCRPTRDKAQLGAAPQWQIVGEFLAKAKAAETVPLEADADAEAEAEAEAEADAQAPPVSAVVEPPLPEVPAAVSAALAEEEQPMRITPPPPVVTESAPRGSIASTSGDDVIDLAADEAVLSAILRHRSGEWVACPIVPPPTCADKARLAVARDRRLVLVGETGPGLADLRAVGRAYQWLVENRNLIAMALPQLAIDAHAMPRLCLLVDHADASAATLQPLLAAGNVTIQAYRKLRWGGRTGLLLEAA